MPALQLGGLLLPESTDANWEEDAGPGRVWLETWVSRDSALAASEYADLT